MNRAATIDLSKLQELGSLKSGSHSGPTEGACVMEAVAFVAGEPWSDRPQCVSPVIGAFLREWNDTLPTDADRDRLLAPLIPLIVNTRASAAIEKQRSYLALDWMIRTFLPAWLHLARLSGHADKVVALSPIVDIDTAKAAAPIVRAAGEAVAASRAAAGGRCEGSWEGLCEGRCVGRCVGSWEGRCGGRCVGRFEGRCGGRCVGRCGGLCEGRCGGRCVGSCVGSCGGRARCRPRRTPDVGGEPGEEYGRARRRSR